MFCKTIILSNSENLNSNAPKGILTLSKESNYIKGKIRLYNLSSLPASTKIGLYINEKVHISPINKKPNHYEFDLNENIDITQSVYCALIDNSNNDKKVLLEGGSFNGFYFTDSPFDAVLEAKDEHLEQTIDEAIKQSDSCENCNCSNCEYKNYFYENYNTTTHSPTLNNEINNDEGDIKNNNVIENNPINNEINDDEDIKNNSVMEDNTINNDLSYDFNANNEDTTPIDTPQDTIDTIQSGVIEKLEDELIDNIENLSQTLCNENEISQIGEDNNELDENIIDHDESHIGQELNDYIDKKQNDNQSQEQLEFLNDIIYQLDEMFTRYPEDEMLNSIIPNSRFISVEADKPYVLGVIYEDKQLRYIAYGVPAHYNSLPPADLGKHYQWLPLNPRDAMSDGYFMIYQDAINGSLVEIEFEE